MCEFLKAVRIATLLHNMRPKNAQYALYSGLFGLSCAALVHIRARKVALKYLLSRKKHSLGLKAKGAALRNGTMRYTQPQENSFRDMLSAAVNGNIDGAHIHAVACGYSACEYIKNGACFVVVVLMPYTLGYPAIVIRARGPNGAGCQVCPP